MTTTPAGVTVESVRSSQGASSSVPSFDNAIGVSKNAKHEGNKATEKRRMREESKNSSEEEDKVGAELSSQKTTSVLNVPKSVSYAASRPTRRVWEYKNGIMPLKPHRFAGVCRKEIGISGTFCLNVDCSTNCSGSLVPLKSAMIYVAKAN